LRLDFDVFLFGTAMALTLKFQFNKFDPVL
jgi:hypothetical protein